MLHTCFQRGGFRLSHVVALFPRFQLWRFFFLLSFLALWSSQGFAAQATLTWQDPHNTPAVVGGYNLYYWQTAWTAPARVNVGQQLTHTLAGLEDGQTYHFAVTAYDPTGNTESLYSNEVTTTFSASAPVANFTATPTAGTAPLSVTFTNTSTGSMTSRTWTFGDGGTSTAQNPSHTYATAGTYTVGLTVTGPGGSNTLTRTGYITVTAPNTAPVANNGTATTAEDSTASRTLSASDADGNALTYLLVTGGNKGTVSLTGTTTGAYTYTPHANVTGTDTFSFRVNDGRVDSNVATVTVTITPVNDAPVATNGTLSTVEDTVASSTLSASDVDADTLTYSIVTQGAKGTATLTNATTGAYTYTPRQHATGTDTLTFRVSDGKVQSNIATVTVTITAVNDGPVIEIGEARVDHIWQRVVFRTPFVDPVVIATAPSLANDDPGVIRIRNVNTTGFEIRLQEWEYLDGLHPLETVGYLAMEHGRHILPNGAQIEAGRFITDNTSAFGTVTFGQPFTTLPVVVTSIASMNEAQAVTSQVRSINSQGFAYRMQEQRLNPQVHTAETVAYIAWEPSAGTMDDLTFEVNKTKDVVNHTFYRIGFTARFLDVPVFVAGMQTTDSGEPANLRWRNKDLSGVEVQVDEEQSRANDTAHGSEIVGYILLARINPNLDVDNDGLTNAEEINLYGTDPTLADTDHDGMNDGDEQEFWGTLWNTDPDGDGLNNLIDPDADNDGTSDGIEINHGFDPATASSAPALPPLEAGEVSVNHTWTRVTLRELFVDPVVVAKSFSRNDSAPAVIRLRNIDATGFEIRLQEWDYLDGIHAAETVGYLVMERGNYTLPDDTRVEAGSFTMYKTGSFIPATFGQPFQVAPVVHTTVASFNEGEAVTTRIRRISPQGFDIRMQEQELNFQRHTAESIAYIAWEPSAGTLDGRTFAVRTTGDVVTDQFHPISYTETFTGLPVFLADMQTTDNSDTANLRWRNPTLTGISVKVAEEQSFDAETTHPTEVVGYIVIK